MFIWDFVADKILGQIVDWFYSQVVGFLGNFFSEMGSMGAELFEMNWVQSVVLFFSYLGWALFATGLVVAVFECGIEYSAGRGNVKETALNVLKGFLAVSLFTQVPVRLYSLAISLQGTLTAGITGFGSTSIGDAAKAALADLENLESLTESTYPLRGFGRETSGLMVLFCLILMAYAVIKVFFSNLKRGGILLIQIAVGSLYMFSVPRGYGDGFVQWCKQVIGLCLTAPCWAWGSCSLPGKFPASLGPLGWTPPRRPILPRRFTQLRAPSILPGRWRPNEVHYHGQPF